MKTQEAIEKRASVREFSNKPVKFGQVLEAIDAANQAPFAGNINHLKFIIVETKENKNYIAEFAQQYWINESQWVVIICSESKRLEQLYQDRGEMYGKQQAGAAIQNFLLSITEQGLGACWVGAFSEREIKTKFKIPESWQIEAIIPIGYSKSKKQKQARKNELETKVFWEKWDQKKKPLTYPHKDPSTN
ncbi:MAG: nitroreductase family protein [Nanoarchaeota archaeon]